MRVARYSLIVGAKRKSRTAGSLVKKLRMDYPIVKTTAKIEYYEKRFGIIAIEKGFITPDKLIDSFLRPSVRSVEVTK